MMSDLDKVNAQIERLREEIAAKDTEIERLRGELAKTAVTTVSFYQRVEQMNEALEAVNGTERG